MIGRREFLQAGALAAAAPGVAPPRRMNVLLIMADQHQAALMGCEGHPQAITPNLDRLASQGAHFTRTYTQNPICTPSRMSIFTGQYCHNHGYYGLGGAPPQNHLVSFLLHFKRHGYKTAAFGKIHTPLNPDEWVQPHCDLLVSYRQHNDYLTQLGLRDKEDTQRLPEFPGKQQHEGRPSNLPYRHSMEGFCVTEAVKFMDSCKDQPFCMEVSFPKPHECYTPDRRFWDMYPADLALPRTLRNSAAGRPPHFQRMVEQLKNYKWLIEPKTFEDGCRRVWRAYLGCISHMDFAVGELLDYLEKSGRAANTLVIYTADHGGYEGNFGIAEKAPGICSESVCRIPHIWRVPGVTKAGHVSREFVENVDIASTIPALCGLPPMDATDGQDIRVLLAGGSQPVREAAVTENVWSKALRWGPWRFVHYQPELFGKDVGELYNLDEDPEETRNLYHERSGEPVVSQSRKLLLEWLIRNTRHRTILPPGATAEDGTESNQSPILDRVRKGAVNYI